MIEPDEYISPYDRLTELEILTGNLWVYTQQQSRQIAEQAALIKNQSRIILQHSENMKTVTEMMEYLHERISLLEDNQ